MLRPKIKSWSRVCVSSSLIGVLVRHCEDADLPFLPAAESELVTSFEALSAVPDRRLVRGRRYRLGTLLALCLVAVLGGARSLTQTARFTIDGGPDLRAALGPHRATPNASILGRLPARLDGNAVDYAIGAWPGRYCTDPAEEPGDTLVGLALDGKTVRGSCLDGAAVHLLAAALHGSQAVVAQRQVAAKGNETPAFTPVLARLGLRGIVVTADAMHTQHGHAKTIVAPGGHYVPGGEGQSEEAPQATEGPAAVGDPTAGPQQPRARPPRSAD
ncbi:ISAs1 family transposase [Streptomyces sp. NBC_01728]|uniref:ISAs1 family transposase n=1 Tax=unclassified Streptomyces TaxID=2593676 RepID=UPI002256948F|nr:MULTISPECIES: ISAs1 family transposase [unclassified Streptomyces]MCX4457860.1 ISAs1 family transposase [Streptomyces sp. NBC_01719]MCX4497217.1 ISAs1 family transposase [Streptomyces sp. NBC_01728]